VNFFTINNKQTNLPLIEKFAIAPGNTTKAPNPSRALSLEVAASDQAKHLPGY
jgi:hypothetical protein